MRPDSLSRSAAVWLLATALAAATTLLLVNLHASAITAAMVFLVLVVWAGAQSGIAPSLYISILCALSFDYFFLQPYHTFVLAGGPEWVAMASFIASSLAAGRVAEKARQQTRQAEQRREDVERLYTLSQEMLLHEDLAGLMRDLPGLIQRIFALSEVALFVAEQNELRVTEETPPPGLAEALRELAAQHTLEQVEVDGYAAQNLLMGLRSAGALAWKPPGLPREVATAVAAQVAIALTRAMAIETTTRMEASRESERLRAALIDSLTHELRTPLTSIRAAASTLTQREGLDDETRRDLAAVVDEESARLDALIGEAVEMAEIDAQVVKVQATLESPRSFLEVGVDQAQPFLGKRPVRIEAAEPDTPAWFDAQLLGRVLRHLLENAARYSPAESAIVLRSRRTAHRLEFEVEDSGPGIDAADLPLIFEKFYRGKMGAKVGKGTGMGLAIARAILEAHRGGIEAVSTQGKKTIFRFWVPLEKP
ncbi:MAG TPA: ATP-binding protein [Terracidiphilus sp.]|nr:ATP-binding protein [Terracidiphilus sp.]